MWSWQASCSTTTGWKRRWTCFFFFLSQRHDEDLTTAISASVINYWTDFVKAAKSRCCWLSFRSAETWRGKAWGSSWSPRNPWQRSSIKILRQVLSRGIDPQPTPRLGWRRRVLIVEQDRTFTFSLSVCLIKPQKCVRYLRLHSRWLWLKCRIIFNADMFCVS